MLDSGDTEKSGSDDASETGQEMHIHKPKAAHGLREFLSEISVIVIGIVIALSAEQLVERMRWAREVDEAHVGIRNEMESSYRFSAFRVAASPCIERRLATLSDVIERAAAHKPVPKLGPVAPFIDNGLQDSTWQAERASQVLTHFDVPDLGLYGAYYRELGYMTDAIFKEIDAWAELQILEGDPARLKAEDFAGLRRAIQHAKYDNKVLTVISAEEVKWAKQLHLPTPKAYPGRLEDVCARQPLAQS